MNTSTTTNSKKSLRVGIMCSSLEFAAWEVETIRNMLQVDGVSINLLIGNADILDPIVKKYAPQEIIKQKIFIKIFKGIKRRIHNQIDKLKIPLWDRYIRFINTNFPADCDKRISMASELIDIDIMYCRVEKKGKYSQYFSQDDIERIRIYNLDVILRFGFNIIRGEILELATYGVWSFHHGDHLKFRGGPPGFWEIFNKEKYSGAILQQLTDKLDDGKVLYQGKIETNFTSYNSNKNNLFWSTVRWPATVCRKILNGFDKDYILDIGKSTAPILTRPTNAQLLKYFWIIFIKIFNRDSSSAESSLDNSNEQWAIGIVQNPVENLINATEQIDIKWLSPSKNNFIADPFLIKKNNQNYIFFEDFSFKNSIGKIGMMETIDFKQFSEPKVVLEQSFHLSYPFMQEYNGNYYCIPEQYQSGEVAIYLATEFPFVWKKDRTLIPNFPGVDPTLLHHNNKWWMFLGNQSDNDSSKLYIYHANELLGDWIPHKNNPVKIFPNQTRPGGKIINLNGTIIRPTQNCCKTYGGSLIFNKIIQLSEDNYQEKFIGELFPNIEDEYNFGLHHIIQNGDMTIIDGKKWIKKSNVAT